jgi:hypothetical protein
MTALIDFARLAGVLNELDFLAIFEDLLFFLG